MVKAHPQWTAVYDKVANNEIGALRLIQGMFSYHNTDPQNIRNIPEAGGGAMWDIGCYPVTLSRYLFREEPIRVAASLEFDPVMNTDLPIHEFSGQFFAPWQMGVGFGLSSAEIALHLR